LRETQGWLCRIRRSHTPFLAQRRNRFFAASADSTKQPSSAQVQRPTQDHEAGADEPAQPVTDGMLVHAQVSMMPATP